MDAIFDFFKDFTAMLPTIKIMDIIDILVVAFIIYGIITMIQTTGAARIAKSIVIILALTVVTQLLNMYLMNYLLDKILEIGLIALVIMFQPELRRMLEKLGGKSLREVLSMKEEQREIDRVIAQTVSACETMSKERTGVLIVFERDTSLMEYQKSGTVIDARDVTDYLCAALVIQVNAPNYMLCMTASKAQYTNSSYTLNTAATSSCIRISDRTLYWCIDPDITAFADGEQFTVIAVWL